MVGSLFLLATLHGQVARASFGFTGGMPGFDVTRSFILTDKDAIGMLPPRTVCPGAVDRYEWSPDGNYLLVQRTNESDIEDALNLVVSGQAERISPDSIHREIDVYSVRANKVVGKVPIEQEGMHAYEYSWLHGSNYFVVDYQEVVTDASSPQKSFISIAALVSVEGQVKEIYRSDAGNYLRIYPSPFKAVVAVEVIGGPQVEIVNGAKSVVMPTRSLRFYQPTGEPSPDIALPEDFSQFAWSADGSPCIITRKLAADKKVHEGYIRINLADGKLAPVDKRPDFRFETPDPGFKVQEVSFRIPKGDATSLPSRGFILKSSAKSEAAAAIITTDGKNAALSPTNDAVAFTLDGVPMVRPFIHMPKDQFIAARNAAIRTAILSQAKQVALGFIMNANDNDDNLAANGSDWRTALDPYLKDPTLLDGFVYTFAGGNMSGIESPGTTMLGYIDGPGGRAVAYTDGHCKWIPNP